VNIIGTKVCSAKKVTVV